MVAMTFCENALYSSYVIMLFLLGMTQREPLRRREQKRNKEILYSEVSLLVLFALSKDLSCSPLDDSFVPRQWSE